MFRIYDHGTGRYIAETTSADMLRQLVLEHAGQIPPRFWVKLATVKLAVVTAANPGYTNIDVRMEAF